MCCATEMAEKNGTEECLFVCSFVWAECVCVFWQNVVTLHPASNLRRHDGRRSFVWLLSVVAEVELATTDDG